MAAVTDAIRTAPALISLMIFTIGWYSGDTILQSFSMAELTISSVITMAMQIRTMDQSALLSPTAADKATTSNATMPCILPLRSVLKNDRIPLPA